MITRRSLLLGSLAAGLAPAIITTPGLLMPVRTLWVPGVDGAWRSDHSTLRLCTGDTLWVHAGEYRRARILEHDGTVRYATFDANGDAMFLMDRATSVRRWEVAA